MTTAKATTALALLLCFSCSRSPRVVVDMYDGFEFAGQRLVPVAATTFVVALIDPDDSKVLYEFTILDHQVRPLPLTVGTSRECARTCGPRRRSAPRFGPGRSA